MSHVIAVSWSMPPVVLPRSIQIARSLKALGQRGWASDVVCAPDDAVEGATLDPAFSALYQDHYRRHLVECREALQPSAWPRRLMRKLRPPADVDQDNWIRRAGASVLRLARSSQNHLLVTFAQPWINHRVGLDVKRRRPDLPWLAHFSDPWVDSLYLGDDGTDEKAEQMRLWREQESAIIRDADAVAFVTRQTADLVMRKYPRELGAKVHIVPHGFDRDAAPVQPSSTSNAPGPLRLVHTGNIYAGVRDPRCLFEALGLMGGIEALKGRIEVAFYGNAPVETLADLDRSGLQGIVSFAGAVGYLESLEIAAGADALLLIDADAEVNVFMPSKTVDYLMLGRPILALTPKNGATADALAITGHVVTPPGDPEALAQLLASWIDRHEQGAPLAVTAADAVERFDILRTTDALETALEAAVESAARR